MMVGNWSYSQELRLSTKTFNQVQDLKYALDLGCLTALKILKLGNHEIGKLALD
jgi:hypothetical protein